MPLTATLLGRIGFAHMGGDVGPVSRKGAALLAYLCLRPEGARREDLADLLWGPGRLANLRQELYALRHLRGASEWLAEDGDSVRLDAVTDVQALEDAESDDAVEVVTTGELLPGLDRVASPAFVDWLEMERRRVAELTVRAARAVAERLRGRGRHRDALAVLDAALELEPLDERLVRAAMRAAYAAGEVRRSLERFATFRDSLREELGFEPAPETATLESLIRRGEPLPVEDELGRLEPELRGLSQVVAVAAGALDVEAIARVVERMPLDVAADLARLESAGWLEPDLTLTDRAEQVVLASTPDVVKRLLHHRVAGALRAVPGSKPDTVARHLLSAGDAGEAAPVLLEAAEKAIGSADPATAVPHLMRALWSAFESPPIRLQAALLLEGCAAQLGDLGLQEAALAEAEALAWQLQTDAGMADVRMRRSRSLLRAGKVGEGLESALEALEIATRLGDERLIARARNAVGGAQFYAGDLQGAEQSFLQNVDVADPVERYRARNNLGGIAGVQGRTREALSHLEIALTLGRAAGEHASVAGTLNNLAATAERLGDYRRALKHFKESLTLAKRSGSESHQGQVLVNLSVVYTRLGELGPAWNTAVEVEEIAEQLREPRLMLLAQEQKAEIATHCGCFDDAFDLLAEAARLAEEVGDERKASAVEASRLVAGALADPTRIAQVEEPLARLSGPQLADVAPWLWLGLALASIEPEAALRLCGRALDHGSESEHIGALAAMARLRVGFLQGATDDHDQIAHQAARELEGSMPRLEFLQAPHARLLLARWRASTAGEATPELQQERGEVDGLLASQAAGLPRSLLEALRGRPAAWLDGLSRAP